MRKACFLGCLFIWIFGVPAFNQTPILYIKDVSVAVCNDVDITVMGDVESDVNEAGKGLLFSVDYDPNSGSFIGLPGNFRVSGNITNTGAEHFFDDSGDFSNTILNGTTQQTISGSGDVNFHGLTIDNPASVLLQREISFSDKLDFLQGNLDLNNHHLNAVMEVNGLWGTNIFGDSHDDPIILNEDQTKRIFGSTEVRLGSTGMLASYMDSNGKNIIGLGATLSQLGMTNISLDRGHTNQAMFGGNSISRYFDIRSTGVGQNPSTFDFQYMDQHDLSGNAEDDLSFFKNTIGTDPNSGVTGSWESESIDNLDIANDLATDDSVDPLTDYRHTLYPCEPATFVVEGTIGNNPPQSGVMDACVDQQVVLDCSNLVVNGTPTFLWSTSETTQMITVESNSPGIITYSVTVTDGNGCTSLGAIDIDWRSLPTVLFDTNVYPDTTFLCEDNVLTLVPIVSQDVATYLWSTGSTLNTLAITGNGSNLLETYSVTVTNDFGCSASASVDVFQVPEPEVDLGPNVTQCDGGTVTLSPGPQPSGYTYLWSNGSNANSITVALTGEYGVTITTPTTPACKNNDSLEVFISDINLAFSVDDVDCFGNSNGFIDLTVNDGIEPYQFNWTGPNNFSSNNEDLPGLSAGNYNVTVTDAIGCTENGLSPVLEPDELVFASIIVVQDSCGMGTGALTAIGDGGTTPYSFSWSNNHNGPSITNLAAGTYFVTMTDANDCVKSTVATVTGPGSLLDASLTITEISCNLADDGKIEVVANGGTPPYTYQWSKNFQAFGGTANVIENLAPGLYGVTVTDMYNCTFTLSQQLTEPDPIIILPDGPEIDVTCFGGDDGAINTTITASDPFGILWSNGLTTEDISNLTAGIYTVTVTYNENPNCTEIRAFEVSEPLEIHITQENIVHDYCLDNNGSIAINAGGGTGLLSYEWSNGEITPTISNLAPDDYTVTITDEHACTKEFIYEVEGSLTGQPLQIDESINHISCHGEDDGQIQLTINGGNGFNTFNWSGPTPLGNVSTANNLSPGTYDVTVTDSRNCTATGSYAVTEPLLLNIEGIVQATTCSDTDDGEIDLTITSSNPYSVLWSNGSTDEDQTGLTAGMYTVTLTYNNNSNCIAEKSFDVTASAPIVINPQVMHDDCGNNMGQIILNASGGTGTLMFEWSNGANTPDIQNLAGGDYTVTITDENSCTKSETIQVTTPGSGLGLVGVAQNISCFGFGDGQISLSVSGGTGPYSYSWDNGAATSSIMDLSAGVYQVTISDHNNCTITESYTIDEPDIIIIQETILDVLCFGQEDGSIQLNVTGGGVQTYQFNWSNGATNSTISQLSAGSYDVTVTGNIGCTATGTYEIAEPAALAVDPDVTEDSCFEGVGQIILNPSGGTGNPLSDFSYTWSNQTNTQDNPNLTPGDYSVTVSDLNNCTLTETISVGGPSQPLAITYTTTDASCLDSEDGGVMTNVSGGGAPFSYEWSNGSSDQNLSNVPAGTYAVTVTSSNNCVVMEDNIIIGEPPAISVIGTENDISCNGMNDGNISLDVSGGGVQSYQYSWSNGANTPILSSLSEGNYTVTVTGNIGCTAVASFSIAEPPALLVNGTPIHGTCGLTDGAIDLMVSGGTPNYSFNWSNGSNSEDLSNLPAGNYSVTVTDDNQCSRTLSFDIDGPSSELDLSFISSDISCAGDFDGSIDVSATGGTMPYQYNWSNGATTEDLDNLPPGSYFLTVTDASGCTKTTTVSITEPDFLGITANIQDASVQGASDGAIDITITGGTPPYSALWISGQTTEDLNNVPNGMYSVRVTDANGCQKQSSFFISYPSVIQVMVDKTDETCAGQNDGSIDLTVSGGVAPYTFMWESGQSSEDISGLMPGVFEVTIQDNGGNQFIQGVFIEAANPFNIFSSVVNSTCANQSDGAIDITISGGEMPYSFNWSNGASSEDLTDIPGGSYAVTVTDNNNCSHTITSTVTEPQELVISFVPTHVTGFGLFNGAIDLSIDGGTGPYSFDWSSGQITEDLNGLSAGDYTVTVNDGNDCTASQLITIDEPQPLIIEFIVTDISCFGQTDGAIDLTISGGVSPYEFNWSNSSTSEDLTNLDNGVYQITVTDTNGNTAVEVITVTEPDNISLQGLALDVLCNGGSDGEVELTVNGGSAPFSFSWSHGDTNQNPGDLAPGTYFVTVTDDNACTAEAGPFVINEPPGLALTVDVTDVSGFGLSDGIIDLTVSGGQAPITFLWSSGNISEDLNGIPAGTYGVTVSDVNLVCTIIDMIAVNEPPQLLVNTDVNNISCFGESDGAIDLTVSGGVPPYEYFWSNGSTNEDLMGLAAGSYSFTVTDNNGVIFMETVEVEEPSELQISGTPSDVLCYGEDNGMVVLTVQGGTTPYQFEWSNGTNNQDLQNANAGSYTVTVTDGGNCTATAGAFDISEPTEINLTLDTEDVTINGLSDGSINLTVSGGSGTYTYDWSTGNISEDINNLFAGIYTVTVTDNNGCTSVGNAEITEPALLDLSADESDISCFGLMDGAIDITMVGGTPPYNYSWSNGADSEDLSNLSVGTYSLTVTDNAGSTLTFSTTIEEPDELTVQGMATDILCNGEMTGSIAIDVFGGTPPYTFNWSNGETAEDLSNLGIGNYSVTVTDERGCTTMAGPFNITEPSPLDLTFTKTDVSTNGGNDGTIDLTISGGILPYSFNWSTGQSFEDLNSLTAGTYSVTVTDDNGCTITQSIDITEPQLLTLDALISDVSCGGAMDGNIDLTISGGAVPYIFEWSNGEDTEDITSLSGGIYEVTVTDDNGNSLTDVFQVNEPMPIQIIGDAMDVSCFGLNDGSVDITVTGGDGSYQFDWSNGTTDEDLSDVSAGDYSVTVTDNNGCTGTNNFTINEPTEITISGTTSPVTCAGNADGGIDIIVTGGSTPYNFAWSSGHATEDLINVIQGDYTVTVTDDNGCSVSEIFTVNEANQILLNPTVTDVSCQGQDDGSISLAISGGTDPFSILWSNGQIDVSQITDLDGGNYGVTVTDDNNCVEEELYMVIEPDALIINAIVQASGCSGTNNDGFIQLNTSGGTLPYAYMWSNNETTENVGNLTVGDYSVTVSDANQCTQSFSFNVQDSEGFAIEAQFLAATPASSEQDLQFIDVSFPKPQGWFWHFGDPANTTRTNPNPVFAYPNDPLESISFYNAKLVVENSFCRDSMIKVIEIINQLELNEEENDEQFIGLKPDFLKWKSFPNPTDDILFVEINLNQPSPVQIRLFDISGKELYRQDFEGNSFYSTYIETGNIPEGSYLLNATIKGGPQKSTLIVISHPGY